MSENLVLDEEIDEDYEPTSKEIEEYAEWLGMDKEKDQDLFWIAKEGLKAPLPKPWKPCQTADGEIFYFNFRTGESVWDHPCDEHYRKVYEEEKKKREKEEADSSVKKKKDKKERRKSSLKAVTAPLCAPVLKNAELDQPLSVVTSSLADKDSAKPPFERGTASTPTSLFGKKPLSFLPLTSSSPSSEAKILATPRGTDDNATLKDLEENLRKEYAEKKRAVEIDLEISTAAAETKSRKQIDELTETNQDLEARISELRTKLEEQEIEKTSMETENKRLSSIIQEKSKDTSDKRRSADLVAANKRLTTVIEEKLKLESENKKLTALLSSETDTARLESVDKGSNFLVEELAAQKNAVTTLETENKVLSRLLEEAKLDAKAEKKLNDANENKRKIEEISVKMRLDDVDENKRQLEDIRVENTRLSGVVEELENEKKRLGALVVEQTKVETENVRLNSLVQELSKNASGSKRLATLVEDKLKVETENRRLVLVVEEMSQMKDENRRLESRLDVLSKVETEKELLLTRVEKQTMMEAEIKRLTTRIEEISAENERLVARLGAESSGMRLNTLQKAQVQEAKVDTLQEEGKRVTELVEKQSKLEMENNRLISDIEDKDAEISAVRRRLETVESETRKMQAEKWAGVFDADKNMTREHGDDLVSIAQADKILHLQQENKTLIEAKGKIQADNAEELTQVRLETYDLKKLAADLQQDNGRAGKRAADLQHENDLAARQLADLRAENAKMEKRTADLQLEKDQVAKRVLEFQNDNFTMEEELSSLRDVRDVGNAKHLRENAKLEADKALLQCEVQKLKQRTVELEGQLSLDTCTTCESRQKEYEKSIQEFKTEAHGHTTIILDWEKKYAALEKAMGDLRREKESVEDERTRGKEEERARERNDERTRMAIEREAEMKIWRMEEEWRQKARDSLDDEQKLRTQVAETLRQCNDRVFQVEVDATRTKNELQLQTDQMRSMEHICETLRAESRRMQENAVDSDRTISELRKTLAARGTELDEIVIHKKGELHQEELAMKRKSREVSLLEQRLVVRERECAEMERCLEDDKRLHEVNKKELAAEQGLIRHNESAVRELEHNLKLCSVEMKQHLASTTPPFATDLRDDILSLRSTVQQLSARRTSTAQGAERELDEGRKDSGWQIELDEKKDSRRTEWADDGQSLDKAKKCLRDQQESLKRARGILLRNQEKWRQDMTESGMSSGSQRVLREVKKVLDTQAEHLNEDLRDVRAVNKYLDEQNRGEGQNMWATRCNPGRIRSLLYDDGGPDDTVARYFPPQSINSLSDVNVSMVDRWRGVLFSHSGGRYTKAGLVSPRKESSSLHHALSLYAIQRNNLRDVLRRHAGRKVSEVPLTSVRASTARPHYRRDEHYY